MKTNEKKIAAISLGCDKNRVDLEKMLYLLKEAGFQLTNENNQPDAVIINTCAFIQPSIEEAFEEIENQLKRKLSNPSFKVFVTGCLSQIAKKEIFERFTVENFGTTVDAALCIKENSNIVEIVKNAFSINEKNQHSFNDETQRVLTTPKSFAFLKISDGCSNGCAYCAIPMIRGGLVSTPQAEVVMEAKALVKSGIKEIVLVAQDLTAYGNDLADGKTNLVSLIKELSKIDDLKWIRLHYCYPEKVTDELLNEISCNSKVCKYVDVPLQHIDDEILKAMNRKSNESQCRALIEKIRQKHSNIVVRTTFIVGLPGESDEKFEKLCNFVEKMKFELAGFFKYYAEPKTRAAKFENQVPEKTKLKRLEKIQSLQFENIQHFANKLIGGTFEAIVDEVDSKHVFCRTMHFSPLVDFQIVAPKKCLINVGDCVNICISGFNGDEFKGDIA